MGTPIPLIVTSYLLPKSSGMASAATTSRALPSPSRCLYSRCQTPPKKARLGVPSQELCLGQVCFEISLKLWIYLISYTSAPQSLGCMHCCAGAEEGVQHGVAFNAEHLD